MDSNTKSILANVKAQNCTTPDATLEEMQQLPWFANPDYLPSFMDSLRRVSNIRTSRIENDIIWRIPIRFWILTQGI
ncbi:hypothetical protein WAF17_09885 [Bernardetia sp. ABR2-2B]|uniref:hypothetical protein n=1 Tax=Bernardetia sp. ABR2-2B TaxID=3127472 RepID=UPI0030D24586